MNNKIEQIVIYFIYFVVVCFGLSLIAFWGSEIIGRVKFYDFIKDHGSLFAGLIGFSGIFILVWFQNKITRETIKSRNLEQAYDTIIILSSYVADLRKLSLHIHDEKNAKIIIDDYHSSGLLKATFLQALFRKLGLGSEKEINRYREVYLICCFLLSVYFDLYSKTVNKQSISQDIIKEGIESLIELKEMIVLKENIEMIDNLIKIMNIANTGDIKDILDLSSKILNKFAKSIVLLVNFNVFFTNELTDVDISK